MDTFLSLLVNSLTFTNDVLHSSILPIAAAIFAVYCLRRLVGAQRAGYQED